MNLVDHRLGQGGFLIITEEEAQILLARLDFAFDHDEDNIPTEAEQQLYFELKAYLEMK